MEGELWGSEGPTLRARGKGGRSVSVYHSYTYLFSCLTVGMDTRMLNGHLTMNESIKQKKKKRLPVNGWKCAKRAVNGAEDDEGNGNDGDGDGGGGQAQTSERARSHALSAPVWGLPRGGEG